MATKVDEKGRVRCWPHGRKGFWKRNAVKAFRRFCKNIVRDQQGEPCRGAR